MSLATCAHCGVTGPSDRFDRHHVSRRTKHTMDKTITLCRSCHTWVESNPKKAQELGLLDYSDKWQTERQYHEDKD